ncbi:cytidyltransferase [Fusibacter bizertensis]
MINRVQVVIGEIEKELLNRSFLKNFNLTRKKIVDLTGDDRFKEQLTLMIEENKYHCKDVLNLLSPFFNSFDNLMDDTEWLKYFYQYSLSFSFPEAVSIMLDTNKNKMAEVYLRVLKIMANWQMKSKDGTWQSQFPLELLSESEIENLEDKSEYLQFKRAYQHDYVYEMMKLNQDVIGYTTLDHICGVNHLAMKTARQLKKAGFPIDLGRVSGAAIGHDVGKFGCKADEMSRVAYYHYFYTGEWFERRGIVYIRNVAINHSTWDLELDALPIESLILIYSDFRVKAERINHKSHMRFYNLKDSFDVILEKLDNVDEIKENRYKRVYAKLRDFEDFLIDLGIKTEPNEAYDQNIHYSPTVKRKYFTLMQGAEITQNVIFSSIDHNIELLHRLRDEASLNKMLEPVRNSRDLTSLRGYIAILEEYYNYLTQKQKQIMLNFLYEKLVLPEEDIRKQCAELIGTIIASYDEEIRKEIPPSASIETNLLDTLGLLKLYIDKFINPESKIIDRHKKFISYSMRDMLDAYFKHLKGQEMRIKSFELTVNFFIEYSEHETIRFYLIKAARILPFSEFTHEQTYTILNFVSKLLTAEDFKVRLRAYNLIYSILPYASQNIIEQADVSRVLKNYPSALNDPAENYARFKLAENLKLSEAEIEHFRVICQDDLQFTSNIFLSNLKSATIDVAKRFQIELLMRNTLLYDYENCFYMAMHLCNLLKVSALESVRNTAGRMLLNLIPHLSYEQKNDIAVELLRALEMESYEFTKYIPPYLGKIILQVKPKELDEIIESFERKMSTNNEKLIALIEKTVGYAIAQYADYRYAFRENVDNHNHRVLRLFGVLFNGFVHGSSYVNQMAFSVIAKDVLTDKTLGLKKKEYLYKLVIKKVMSLMINTDETEELIFYNNTSSLKYIYSFISEFNHNLGPILLEPNRRIAFFPGAFDPFTLSHKQIANDIKNLGFEVTLYVDEFSWSKRTQPNLIRRNIIKKSIASEIDIYQFPRDISINIANDKDLLKLKALFPDSEIFIVVGSDVVLNASAYKGDVKKIIHEIPHIVYERFSDEESNDAHLQLDEKFKMLHPDSLRFTLPKDYEHISSTLIRDSIDEKRDISTLIEPLAQNYIYEKSLYQREPMYKSIMTTKSIFLEVLDDVSDYLYEEFIDLIGTDAYETISRIKKLTTKQSFKIYILRSLERSGEIVAISISHWLRATEIHHEFLDQGIINYIRTQSIGRISVIDGIIKRKGTDVRNVEQIMLTETLAHALSRDYTYSVFKESLKSSTSKEVTDVLDLQGFVNISSNRTNEHVHVVNMSSPCTLNLDIHSMFKEPYRSTPEILQAMGRARHRLQKSLTGLYPGNLVLNFDRAMIYENLIKKVCEENQMPTVPIIPKTVGNAMCVPFGAVFKRWLIPNTVTKTLHAEKYFSPDLLSHQIMEYPFYLDIENQIKMLKSFDRPVILVDDLLNKGYRVQALEPYFKKYDLEIQKFIVAIMSGQGKEIAESMNIKVDSAYFIPKIKVWFYESKLYPFIDGDAIWRGSIPDSNLINSVNLILPYSSASYITDTSQEAIYNVSETALINSIEIMSALEIAYEKLNDRLLTIDRLGEVLNTPRYPDKGKHIFYSDNIRPSEYIKDDLEQLRKMKSIYIG